MILKKLSHTWKYLNNSKKSDLKALELAEDFKAMRALENDPTLFMLHPKIHTVPDS